MITLFLLSLMIKATGIMLMWSFRFVWEVVAFVVAFLVSFLVSFVQAARAEYMRIQEAS